MKRLLEFFTNKWVLGVIGLSALSLLIWFGAGYIKFGADNTTLSELTRGIIIGVIWAIWLTWNLSQWLVERKQNRELLKDLEEAQEASNPDEERSKEELAAISQRFREAMSTLKKSRFKARGGSKSLYQLPWYIIIGPPGSGKTTALVNSGLEFPLAQSHGKEALGGVGGTRNCDWWFTNDAVLIDTAGRYTTQDSHRVIDNSAWNAFLSLLKKYRRRRPINGAIIAISLQDLMVQTAEQRLHQAKTLRTRINELQKELGIRFPIYLNFTKCDLVAGFSEFFANLSQAEREQVWGVSFPTESSPQAGADIDSFAAEFDQLVERLNQRLLWRVHQERNIEKRSVLQSFPARMEGLADIITDFVNQTFKPNRYDTVPMVRGVYFSSATQEGSPIDRMMAQVSANFGLERDMGKQQHNSGKSFFISRLLKDVIFPESELVGVNRKIERATIWFRRIAFAGFASALVGSILLWSGSVAQNKIFMSDVDDNLTEFMLAEQAFNTNSSNPAEVLTVLNPLHQASLVYDQEDHPLLNNLGLYDGRVDIASDQLYRDKLNTVFLPSLISTIEQHLNTLTVKDAALLPIFKMYLMLFDEQKLDYQMIRSYAQTRWQDELPGRASEQEQLLMHLDNLFQQPFTQAIEPNERVVSRARQQLRRIPVAQRLYTQLKSSGNNAQIVDLYNEIGGDMRQAFGLAENSPVFSMPYLFTKAGYKETDFSANSDLMEQMAKDRWIYGDDMTGEDFSEADREKLSKEIEQIYLNEYAKRWQDFIDSFTVVKFTSTSQALNLLQQLSDPIYSPLLAVSELTANNTQLTPQVNLNVNTSGVRAPVSSTTRKAAGALADAASSAMGEHFQPNVVDLRFQDIQRMVTSVQGRPAQLQDYLSSIQTLHEYLTEIDSAPNANEAAFKSAKARFSGAGGDAIKQLRIKSINAPDVVKDWLTDLADNTWGLVMAKTKRHVDAAWRDQVYANYQSNLYNRYPMTAGRDTETPVMAFNDYFKAGGIEQAFVSAYLKPFMDTRRWKVKSFEGQSLPIKQSTLTQLRRATNIRSAYFSVGDGVAIKFRIEPTKLDSSVRLFALEVGETRVPYSHGPRTQKNVTWTGGEDNRVRIIFEDLNETMNRRQYEGDWAWLRLLDNSQLSNTNNNNVRKVVFNENGRSAEFKLYASSSVNPFDLGLLRNYRCPQGL
ncbi:type VI secretion system membrane subunit TssM [Agaribacterium sp. ZY112]|uniref:type VI secretion system membrane subunit TssM n=1 Tax=Agaribacterium sp. ZY112 TaxID=3233574 RepID=UPI0035246759